MHAACSIGRPVAFRRLSRGAVTAGISVHDRLQVPAMAPVARHQALGYIDCIACPGTLTR